MLHAGHGRAGARGACNSRHEQIEMTKSSRVMGVHTCQPPAVPERLTCLYKTEGPILGPRWPILGPS
eukprot:12428835-Karenia_brevis.AAC.1